ncbi:MAG: RDD family protein [bacterium]
MSDTSQSDLSRTRTRAAVGWRLLADLLDFGCGCVLGYLAAHPLGGFFVDRAVATLHIGQPDTVWKGPFPLVLGLFGTLVYSLPCILCLVWLAEPLFGASPGKHLLRIKLLASDGGPLTAGKRWRRYLLKTGGLWFMVLALLLGNWQLLMAGTAGIFSMWLGGLVALVPPGYSLLDRLAGSAPFRE